MDLRDILTDSDIYDDEDNYYLASSDDDELIRVQIVSPEPSRLQKSKFPPFVIMQPIEKFLDFMNPLVEMCEESPYCQRMKDFKLKVFVRSLNDYNQVKAYLLRNKIKFFTYTFKWELAKRRVDENPLLKVAVLKGIPRTVDPETIVRELCVAGLNVDKCGEIKKQFDIEPRMHIVFFKQAYHFNDIEKIKTLCLCSIKWEMVRRKPNHRMRCYRCQTDGHAAKNCYLVPKCAKCSGKHATRNCFKARMNDITNALQNQAISRQFLPKRKNRRRRNKNKN